MGMSNMKPVKTDMLRDSRPRLTLPEKLSLNITTKLELIFSHFLILLQVNSNQWTDSSKEQSWAENSIVALIEWLPKLTKTTMPTILRQHITSKSMEPIDLNTSKLQNLDETQLEHLVQWSDLIIFDYITGNYDRVASMQVMN